MLLMVLLKITFMKVLFLQKPPKHFPHLESETSGMVEGFSGRNIQYQKMILIWQPTPHMQFKNVQNIQSQPTAMEILLKIMISRVEKDREQE